MVHRDFSLFPLLYARRLTQPQTSPQPSTGVKSTESGRSQQTQRCELDFSSWAFEPWTHSTVQHKPAHPDFPSPRLSPQALSPQSQECALVTEEYSINWVSLLNPHCAPDPVLGLDKRRPFHLVPVGGWALPSYRLHRV